MHSFAILLIEVRNAHSFSPIVLHACAFRMPISRVQYRLSSIPHPATIFQILLPRHMFPKLAWSKATTMANGDIKVDEPQADHRKGKGKKKRNWKDEEILQDTLYEDRDCFLGVGGGRV